MKSPEFTFSTFRSRKIAGFSLVEVMVAIAILSIIFSGLLAGQLQSNRIAARARNLNNAKVALRTLIDRAQTVAREDVLLRETYPWGDSPIYSSNNIPGTNNGGVITLYDENPDFNDRAGTEYKLLANVERAVTYADGSAATPNALIVINFRISFQDRNGPPATISMSTNRAVP